MSVVVGEHMGVQNSSIMGSGVDECVSRHASSGGQVLLEATHLEFVGRSYDWSGKGKGKQGVGGENITVTGGLEKIKLRGMILWLFWN